MTRKGFQKDVRENKREVRVFNMCTSDVDLGGS